MGSMRSLAILLNENARDGRTITEDSSRSNNINRNTFTSYASWYKKLDNPDFDDTRTRRIYVQRRIHLGDQQGTTVTSVNLLTNNQILSFNTRLRNSLDKGFALLRSTSLIGASNLSLTTTLTISGLSGFTVFGVGEVG